MDPTTVCCPHLACSARGHSGQGHIGIHAQQDRRFMCPPCRKTCSAPKGTVLYRRRTAAETVALVVTLLAHGCPVRHGGGLGVAERTVAAWWARSGRQGQAVQEPRVAPPRDVGQVHAEASRGQQPGGLVWRARARLVQTRVGRGGAVSEPRAMPLIRRLMERVRRGAHGVPGGRSRWRGPPSGPGGPVRGPGPRAGGRPRRRGRWSWRPSRPARRSRRVVDPARRLGASPPAQVEAATPGARGRGEHDGGGARTAPFRGAPDAAGAPGARRRPGRGTGPDASGRFSWWHATGASAPPQGRDHTGEGRWHHGAWRDRQAWRSFSGAPPRWTPPRGRPSRALKRLVERWCPHHGWAELPGVISGHQLN
jgi:transposase-like protein